MKTKQRINQLKKRISSLRRQLSREKDEAVSVMLERELREKEEELKELTHD